jgi:hypothetical protein
MMELVTGDVERPLVLAEFARRHPARRQADAAKFPPEFIGNFDRLFVDDRMWNRLRGIETDGFSKRDRCVEISPTIRSDCFPKQLGIFNLNGLIVDDHHESAISGSRVQVPRFEGAERGQQVRARPGLGGIARVSHPTNIGDGSPFSHLDRGRLESHSLRTCASTGEAIYISRLLPRCASLHEGIAVTT